MQKAREFIEKEYMNESKKPKKVVRNDEGKVVPEHCSCGGKIGVFIEGEPIYKCTACGKYYGTMPFPKKGLNESLNKENKNMKKNVIKVNETQLRQMIAESVKKVLNEQQSHPIVEGILKENKVFDFFRNLFSRNRNEVDNNELANLAFQVYNEMQGRQYNGDEIYSELNNVLNDFNIVKPNDRNMIAKGVCTAFGVPFKQC